MVRAATPERLTAFSDRVFAVLITVLVLDLRPPEVPAFKALLLHWPMAELSNVTPSGPRERRRGNDHGKHRARLVAALRWPRRVTL